MPHNFGRQTPAELKLEEDVKMLYEFSHYPEEPPELGEDVRSIVELFAQDYTEYGIGKSPEKYILELYQLQNT